MQSLHVTVGSPSLRLRTNNSVYVKCNDLRVFAAHLCKRLASFVGERLTVTSPTATSPGTIVLRNYWQWEDLTKEEHDGLMDLIDRYVVAEVLPAFEPQMPATLTINWSLDLTGGRKLIFEPTEV